MPSTNDKNETTRFLGDGVSFKAKLIGILEVSEARGDRMCQEALSDLKMAIRAAGEHKQRITINIAIDGLRLRDEKTGDSLYHHPVHKISFIAQDMTDSRAFGYIFGSPDTGHRFFGIKTDKAASQVVIAMRDLFQVVFALKKKEIELAKQLIDKNRGYSGSPSLFSDSSVSSTKSISQEATKNTTTETKLGATASEPKSGGTAVADLVDLELELNSLQQGLNQMERITPSDPFGSKDDPFGDSFISYPPKPILPPPPSSGRERSSRTSDTSGSIFSPKTPHTSSMDGSADISTLSAKSTRKDFSFSHDFSSSREEPSSGDWFGSSGNSIFEEPTLLPEPTKDEKHEMTKQEILSQFDVFTELDPLGTGRSKPYIDKKHFFQELKNPPKKVLNDLVAKSQPQEQPKMFTTTFTQPQPKQSAIATASVNSSNMFTSDPFGEDPFIKVDPFAEDEFTQGDPFETVFYGRPYSTKSPKIEQEDVDHLHMTLYQSNASRSPNTSILEKQMSLMSTSPRTVQFSKQNTFDSHFDRYTEKTLSKLSQLHENPSLDMSSESESAPEPPPRPAATLLQIKPPPLPPKKQANDLSSKPPPRPPHTEDSHYEFIDNYETAPNSLDYFKNIERSPPLPVPARKSKFESDFTIVPDRPKKHFNVQSSEEDYLTPISFPEHKSEIKTSPKPSGPLLLPPPQRSARKQAQSAAQVTVSSFLQSSPSLTTSTATENLNTSLEGLDITLSQLTLTGLNELATKLNIPASQLSNMTLVQLTNYLSNFIKSSSTTAVLTTTMQSSITEPEFPAFKADFAANFNNFNNSAGTESTYDRYAVFRELIKEEIKQTKIDTEPEEIREEKEELANIDSNVNNLDAKPIKEISISTDKYAALREIVEIELTHGEVEEDDANKNETEIDDTIPEKDSDETNRNIESVENDINLGNNFSIEETGKQALSQKDNIIEYSNQLDNKLEIQASIPLKSPVSNKITPVKSPVPVAVTEIIQTNARMTSGSLSDVISGSSPEVDNTGSNDEVGKKNGADVAGESWAIFDQANIPVEAMKEKRTEQSEEGISPWSSDSKEFGNGSPPEWRQRIDSESGGDQWSKRSHRRDQEGWWDTSAEPEAQFYPASNRRSTDSYDEEYYECYDRPRRSTKRQQPAWSNSGGHVPGGHSSSSRDVSPWEEEPRRRDPREGRSSAGSGSGGGGSWGRHPPRQQTSFGRRERRATDSWDEEDDYEYEDEHMGRFHWSERHSSRDSDRDRHSAGSRDHDSDRWTDEWTDDRRHRRRREVDRDRWCCPDWEQGEHEKHLGRYGSRERWSGQEGPPGKWRDRKHEDRYHNRDSQDSPWEDDYSNEPEDGHSPHYLSAPRNWKRPSSASEMDRKTGEIKSRHHLGGSDNERDRRYKGARRSRSRDSQYSEPSHRHRPDSGGAMRSHLRSKPHSKPQYDSEFIDLPSKKTLDISKLDISNKKTATLAARKKPKDSPKTEESIHATFPRKSTARAKSLFENDFVPQDDIVTGTRAKFSFENDFETSEAESPTVSKPSSKASRPSAVEMRHLPLELRQRGSYKESRVSPRFPTKSKSLFEDDFSPSDKTEQLPEDNGISSIKEEMDPNEEEDSFGISNVEHATNSRKKMLSKNRLSGSLRADVNLKKSESINIFARESDPFDDDFFFGEAISDIHEDSVLKKISPRNVELKWTEDFDKFDIKKGK